MATLEQWSSSVSASDSFDSTPTSGNLLVSVFGIRYSSGGPVGTTTAPSGWTNAWASNITPMEAHTGALAYKVSTGSESGTIAWSYSTASGAFSTMLMEWSGITDPILDKTSVNGSGSSNTSSIATGSTGTLSDSSGVAVVVGLDRSLPDGTSLTVNSGFTELMDMGPNSPGFGYNMSANYLNLTATTALNVTITGGNSRMGAGIAVFVPNGAPPPPTIPETVSDLAGTPSNTEVTLTWTAPADGGSAIVDYEYRVDGGVWTSILSVTTGYVVTGLTNGVLYNFEVRAINGVGASLSSNLVSYTPVAPPSEVVEIYQDFESFADGATFVSDGWTASGTAGSWLVYDTNVGLDEQQKIIYPSVGSGTSFITYDVGANDHVVVRASKRAGNQLGGPITHYLNTNNFLLVEMVQSESAIKLYKRIAGVYTEIGIETGISFTLDAFYELSIEVEGDQCRMYRDGVLKATATLSPSDLAALGTRVGFFSELNQSNFGFIEAVSYHPTTGPILKRWNGFAWVAAIIKHGTVWSAVSIRNF